MKICNTCEECRPFSDYHKDKYQRDGLCPKCKICKSKYMSKYYEDNKKQIVLSREGYAAEWYIENRERILEKHKNYYYENIEKIRAAKYHLNQNDNVKRAREWEKKNPERNKEIRLAASHRRRAKLKNCNTEFDATTNEIANLKRESTRCFICGNLYDSDRIKTLEHIVPVDRQGTNALYNLTITCKPCNCSRPKDGSDLCLLTQGIH